MTEREFNVQVMESKAQWDGLYSRLEFGADGLSLFVNPAFESWLVKKNWPAEAGDLVVDECGEIYWTELEIQKDDKLEEEKRVWKLLRRNPTTGHIETVITFAGCGAIEPRKLWLSADYLWILDQRDATVDGTEKKQITSRSGRLLALSLENFQILHEFTVENMVDLDLSGTSFFYTLIRDGDKCRVCRHSIPQPYMDQQKACDGKQSKPSVENFWKSEGEEQCWKPGKDFPTARKWIKPEALAVAPNGMVYVLDPQLGGFIRIDPKKQEETFLRVTQPEFLQGKLPRVMEIDQRGVIFLVSTDQETKHDGLFMFDKGGSSLRKAELPSSIKTIDGIGFDRKGGVYLATDQGLARFSLASNPVGQDGFFYSRTLDNGDFENLWHRIALKGSIPPKSSVEVSYFTSDNEALKTAHDATLAATGSEQERADEIDNRMSWIGPEIFTGADFEEPQSSDTESAVIKQQASPDLLIDPNKGRFLWFKLRLINFDHKTRPSINSVRVYYPRLSYLRYLPPAYREDAMSAAFLDRFLSLFESIFDGLDQQIDELFRYFDPRLTPKEFLPWLASWINVSLDDDVPAERIRRFIQLSPSLFNRKGTPEALIEFLETYTGKPVFLTEHSRGLKPLVLGADDFRLGKGAMLLGSGPRGMSVGDTTVVGYAAIRDRISDPDEPFLSLARRFSVVIDIDPREFQRLEKTLQRIVAEQKPAHTSCTLRSTAAQGSIGNVVVGVSGTVTDTRPYRVGVTPLGTGSAIAEDRPALRLERGASVGSSKRL